MILSNFLVPLSYTVKRTRNGHKTVICTIFFSLQNIKYDLNYFKHDFFVCFMGNMQCSTITTLLQRKLK